MKSSVRDACPLQNLFSIKITQKLLSVFFASSFTMKKRKPAVLYCNRIQTWNVASSNLLENNLFFLNAYNFGTESPTLFRRSSKWPQEQELSTCLLMRYRGMAKYNWWMFLRHTWRSPPFRRWSSWSWPPASASSSQSLWTLNWYHLPPDEQPLWIWWEGGQFVIIYLMLLSDTDNLLSVWDNLLSVAIVI